MKRAVIRILEEKCDGCGVCVPSCAEGAIAVVEGKARVQDERYCDGLGACLGKCPQDAILIEEREAPAFDEEAVRKHLGSQEAPARLQQWPIQLALLAPAAPFLQGADLILAADCAAFAHVAFHDVFLRNRALAIACPKLDEPHRAIERLADIVKEAGIRSITILRMEVPCCGGLERLTELALQRAGMQIPVRSEVISIPR